MSNPQQFPLKTSRIISLDVAKGLIMLVMAGIHCSFFFSEKLTSILFLRFDPFIFPAFLLFFGIGNGLSSRCKRINVLYKLLCIYLIGGLPSAVITYLLKHRETRLSSIFSITLEQLKDAITLESRLSYADFLVPFIVSYAIFLVLQSSFNQLSCRTLITALFISTAFYILGVILSHLAPDFVLRDFYNYGFRSFQSIPIFVVGVCVGLFLRQRDKFINIAPSALPWIAFVFFILAIGSHKYFEAQQYNGWAWKKSGELSYVVIGSTISVLLLILIDGITQFCPNQRHFSYAIFQLKRIGERTMRCLWIQFLLFPVVGYIVSININQSLIRGILALVSIGLMWWLTVEDTIFQRRQAKD